MFLRIVPIRRLKRESGPVRSTGGELLRSRENLESRSIANLLVQGAFGSSCGQACGAFNGGARAKTTESSKPELAAVWGLRLLARALWEELGFPLAFGGSYSRGDKLFP